MRNSKLSGDIGDINVLVNSSADAMNLPMMDITVGNPVPGTEIEIKIRRDGKVIWVNFGPKCILRICGISSTIDVEDERKG